MELLGKDGVINLVSSGHDLNDEPTVPRSTIRKFSTPACSSAMPTPIPAAPDPIIIASNLRVQCENQKKILAIIEISNVHELLDELK